MCKGCREAAGGVAAKWPDEALGPRRVRGDGDASEPERWGATVGAVEGMYDMDEDDGKEENEEGRLPRACSWGWAERMRSFASGDSST